jgi:ribokinase
MAGKIVIMGSCLTALSMQGPRFPVVGETVVADTCFDEVGGKGTNQALAAARLGSDVAMIGCVGHDLFGEQVVQVHREFGVRVEGIRVAPDARTGVAFVMIDGGGRNMIMVAPGANALLAPEDFERNLPAVQACDIIGFQLEVSPGVVEYGIRRASELGVTTLLDPAPARPLDEAIYRHVDYIKPNETEAALLTGIPVTDADSAFRAAQWFLDHGVKNALVTLGEKGVVILNREVREYLTSPKVVAKDPTGAGDIFSAALMHGLAAGRPLVEAARLAVSAAAWSVRTLGVLTAMPTRQQVIDFQKEGN